MINFKSVGLEDKLWIDRLLASEDSMSADFNFTNIYVWDNTYRQKVAEFSGRLLIRLMYCCTPFYAFPVGGGDLKAAVEALREDAAAFGAPLKIRGITSENLLLLEALYPGEFEVADDCFSFDYVYTAQKLAELPGKKLSSKRNHINRFVESNDWSFEPVTEENLRECIAMSEEWYQQNREHGNFEDERLALDRAFQSFKYLGLEGGILRSSGQIIGFTIGERLNSNTYIVHFEKAFSHIQGSYAMINREFARYVRERFPRLVYINREDDMGVENLKKAKRSYYPDLMVEKFTATWSGSVGKVIC